jgi:peptidoglycan hydrolase CwlO-like protein
MMLTVREFVRRNEDKLLAEIEDLKVTISESEVKYRLAESELVVKMAGELTELQSQVDDLQEELGETRAQSNLKDWEIRFLKEDVKRLTAKLYEKRHLTQAEDTED